MHNEFINIIYWEWSRKQKRVNNIDLSLQIYLCKMHEPLHRHWSRKISVDYMLFLWNEASVSQICYFPRANIQEQWTDANGRFRTTKHLVIWLQVSKLRLLRTSNGHNNKLSKWCSPRGLCFKKKTQYTLRNTQHFVIYIKQCLFCKALFF